MKILVVATGNKGKLAEIRNRFASLPLEVKALTDFSPLEEPEEDQPDFEGNARLKARYYSERLGQWVVADDSGLEVDAIGGEPGVHSARYAGEPSNDARNNEKLLRVLEGVPDGERTARFQCVLCITGEGLPGGEQVFSGVVEGRILREYRGEGGFGYDPLFLHPELGRTTAEMSMEEKNAVSHRGKALAKLRKHLEKVLG